MVRLHVFDRLSLLLPVLVLLASRQRIAGLVLVVLLLLIGRVVNISFTLIVLLLAFVDLLDGMILLVLGVLRILHQHLLNQKVRW